MKVKRHRSSSSRSSQMEGPLSRHAASSQGLETINSATPWRKEYYTQHRCSSLAHWYAQSQQSEQFVDWGGWVLLCCYSTLARRSYKIWFPCGWHHIRLFDQNRSRYVFISLLLHSHLHYCCREGENIIHIKRKCKVTLQIHHKLTGRRKYSPEAFQP